MERENRENVELLSFPILRTPNHFCNFPNSPLHTNCTTTTTTTLASIPFSWEEQPGKPHSSNALPFSSIPDSLHLPPRLCFNPHLITKMPSNTYQPADVGRSISFRLLGKDKGVFGYLSTKTPPDQYSSAVGRSISFRFLGKDKGVFGSMHKKSATMVSANKSGTGSSQAKSHLWATIYETLKQSIPRRSGKLKKVTR